MSVSPSPFSTRYDGDWSARPLNVATRLTAIATRIPDAIAVAAPGGRNADGKRQYRLQTFAELDQDSDVLARGLCAIGVGRGMRLVLLVPPSIEFMTLVFALLKSGSTTVLIDPGMGKRNLITCLREVAPDGFVSVPVVQAFRRVLRRWFPKARHNVTVGWGFMSAVTLDTLRKRGRPEQALPQTHADDPAAIIFTTGSTGPPKGVLYLHETFDRQVTELQEFYGIQPGEIDLPGFPLFGLFNAAMGVTTVLPDMDPTRPAEVDPRLIVEAIEDWQVTQAFGSPAIWNRVGAYCEQQQMLLPSVQRVLSAGAPVPSHVLARMKAAIHPDGDVHTPYGATEALPVASISASEVLAETSTLTRQGKGVCAGRPFPNIRWRIIATVDGPIEEICQTAELRPGQIGELIVSGPVVTREYVTRLEANRLAKIRDAKGFWHRMGDVGYLDEQNRFWFCGRMAHRVITAVGTMYTICCEAIFNNHRAIYRSALVGVGTPGAQTPVIVAEPWPEELPKSSADRERLVSELRELARGNELTASVQHVLIHPSLPVDIRHNAKIFREKLAVWAAKRLRRQLRTSPRQDA